MHSSPEQKTSYSSLQGKDFHPRKRAVLVNFKIVSYNYHEWFALLLESLNG